MAIPWMTPTSEQSRQPLCGRSCIILEFNGVKNRSKPTLKSERFSEPCMWTLSTPPHESDPPAHPAKVSAAGDQSRSDCQTSTSSTTTWWLMFSMGRTSLAGPIPFSMQPVSKLYLVWGLYHRLPRMFYTTFWLHCQHGLDCRVPFNSTLARSSWLTDIAARMKQHGVEVNMLLEAPWKNGKVERLGAVAGHSGHDLSDLDPYLKMTSPNALKCLSLPSLSWPSPWVVCKKLPGLPRSGSTQAPEPSWESDLLTPAEGGQPRA